MYNCVRGDATRRDNRAREGTVKSERNKLRSAAVLCNRAIAVRIIYIDTVYSIRSLSLYINGRASVMFHSRFFFFRYFFELQILFGLIYPSIAYIFFYTC